MGWDDEAGRGPYPPTHTPRPIDQPTSHTYHPPPPTPPPPPPQHHHNSNNTRCGTFAYDPYHTLIRKYLEKNGLVSADVAHMAQRCARLD